MSSSTTASSTAAGSSSATATGTIIPSSNPSGSGTPITTPHSNMSDAPINPKQNGVVSATTDGPSNGQAEASSSKLAASNDSYTHTDHTLNLTSYIFDVGYQHQQWTDVHLTFFSSGLKAHRIILSRSPYLAHLMTNSVPGANIHLSFTDQNITQEAVHIAIQHLYHPAQHFVNASNAKSILATAYLLGGMPELVHSAYVKCRDSIDTSNVIDYVQWLGAQPQPYHLSNGFRDAGSGTMYGSVHVHEGQASIHGQGGNAGGEGSSWAQDGPQMYGQWTASLKQDVLQSLIHKLPAQIIRDGKNLTSDPRLFETYVQLPYDLFKHCVESPELPIASKQDRFAFAKKVIAQRKKLATRTAAGGASVGAVGQMEESVVLASGQGDDMEVQVTRKPKRGRTLFKVEG